MWLRAVPGAAGWMILPSRLSASSYRANEKLDIALVGVGKRGRWHAQAIGRIGQNLAAVCDADRTKVAQVLERKPEVPVYQDFRRMLDQRQGQIDAVVIATPDHTHAVIAARAMERGKHVYVEKPIAHDVGEARRLRLLARRYQVATQMGNQGMATDSFRRTVELIQDGVVGQIREVHVWYVFGGSGPQARPQGRPPIPEGLDWDLWLGPAPFRPYHPSYVTSWWAWRDFGTGVLGGGGSHSIHVAFKALNLGALWEEGNSGRIIVEGEVAEPCPENFPRWEKLRFHIPARGTLPPVCIHWYDGSEAELRRQGIWQKLEKIAGRPLQWKDSWTPRSGTLLVGSRGVVHTNAHNSICVLLPEERLPEAAGPPERFPHVAGHQQEWVEACRGGPAPLSNFDHSGPAMELLLLGNVFSRVVQPLEFDPVGCRVLNHEGADRGLRPPRRQSWEV